MAALRSFQAAVSLCAVYLRSYGIRATRVMPQLSPTISHIFATPSAILLCSAPRKVRCQKRLAGRKSTEKRLLKDAGAERDVSLRSVMKKYIYKKVKRICSVPGCSSTDTYLVAASGVSNGQVCLCRECMKYISGVYKQTAPAKSSAKNGGSADEEKAE